MPTEYLVYIIYNNNYDVNILSQSTPGIPAHWRGQTETCPVKKKKKRERETNRPKTISFISLNNHK